MSILQNKIDFAVLISVTKANPNGDPLDGNRPRTDYKGMGEITDVCIKRKIRNRMQDLQKPIFVQSNDRCDDGCVSLEERAKNNAALKGIKNQDEFAKIACASWLDVRTFGQVFAFGKEKGTDGSKGKDGVSVGVRGPVSIHQAVSISPIDLRSLQITKSVNGTTSDKRSADTMGMKHFVDFGLYEIKGSINIQLAEKTGFTEEDAEVLKECLRTLFVNDTSSARPEGSMEVCRLYWWRHNNKLGQYSTAKVHRSLSVQLNDSVTTPSSIEDYEIKLDTLEGLTPELLEGI